MTDDENACSAIVFDATPYLRLVIDKEGRWFQNGAEIIHPGIYKEFCSMLEKTPDGGYLVRMGREVCCVLVEDAPFVVLRVLEDEAGRLSLQLNDETVEALDPALFWIGKDHVPYIRVKAGVFHARFSRAAYYEIARHIVSNDEQTEFFLDVNGTKFSIVHKDEAGPAEGTGQP